MNDVYRDVPDLRRLLPRERDVVTGQRTGRRDDKRRDDQQNQQAEHTAVHASGHGVLGTSLSAGVLGSLVAVALVVLAGAGVGVRALVADDEPVKAVPGVTSPVVTSGVGATSTDTGTATDSVPTEAPATAIELEYVGGRFIRHECSDATGGGECVHYTNPYTPLTVRCTASGCMVFHFEVVSIDKPVSISGFTPPLKNGCKPTKWTLQLTPVGEATTEGIKHPARIVGTATQSRPAELVPKANCLGAVDEYRYDASPS